ncbi:GNAT family N-acetyltransferase [Pelagibius sp. Alg239-R121]|uniref:GNAT family N-acetyltransferase n=1 Tax=Pelagibius sp. Alg239-R121 TaxID=2993448 RepID=UPI0024A66729|nr:GNAT family N-acetyltransferase [Pelagibius sp. Alg239-R121]
MHLIGETVCIRDLRAKDESAFCDILADHRVSGTLRGSVRLGGPLRLLCELSPSERVEKFHNSRRLCIDGQSSAFAVEDCTSGAFIGSIGSYDIDRKRLGLSYWIASSFHGRGIGTALLKLYGRPALKRFGRRYLIANVALDNPASAAAVRKAGFQPSRFADDPGFGLTDGRQLFELGFD